MSEEKTTILEWILYTYMMICTSIITAFLIADILGFGKISWRINFF
ncbi:hypothetical protein [Tenacibaculum halocynthiae]